MSDQWRVLKVKGRDRYEINTVRPIFDPKDGLPAPIPYTMLSGLPFHTAALICRLLNGNCISPEVVLQMDRLYDLGRCAYCGAEGHKSMNHGGGEKT